MIIVECSAGNVERRSVSIPSAMSSSYHNDYIVANIVVHPIPHFSHVHVVLSVVEDDLNVIVSAGYVLEMIHALLEREDSFVLLRLVECEIAKDGDIAVAP